jgi:hypothetical protein
VLAITIRPGAITTIRFGLNAGLDPAHTAAKPEIRMQGVLHVDETSGSTHSAIVKGLRATVGSHHDGLHGWQWVMVTSLVTMFLHDLSRSVTAATDLLGSVLTGTEVKDRFSACNHLYASHRHLCWVYFSSSRAAKPEFHEAIDEICTQPQAPQLQRLHLWFTTQLYNWKTGKKIWLKLKLSCLSIPIIFKAIQLRAEDMIRVRGERTTCVQSVRILKLIAQRKKALMTFLDRTGIEPTDNAAKWTLGHLVIHSINTPSLQSVSGMIYRRFLLTLATNLNQQRCDLLSFLEQAWITDRYACVMACTMPGRLSQ